MLGLHDLKVDMTKTHRPKGYYHCMIDNISKQSHLTFCIQQI